MYLIHLAQSNKIRIVVEIILSRVLFTETGFGLVIGFINTYG
jgi:hypothetical protein